MPAAEATIAVPLPLAEAERRWYDTDGWPGWVDGLDVVERVDGPWPAPGGEVRWRSPPAGRGAVIERVLEHEPGEGQVVEVQDDTLSGRQRVRFHSAGPALTEVTLRLEYRVRRRHPLTLLLELLFINTSLRRSLEATLERFAS